jgi:uncharacterized damage-inducible protein DinB
MKRAAIVVSAVIFAAAAGQQTKPAPTAGKPTTVTMVAAGPITTSIKAGNDEVKDYIMRAAQMVTDKEYEFRPQGVASEVRNYGQLLGHIANVNYAFCGASQGVQDAKEQGPKGENFEKVTTKVEMQKALAASFAYCDKAYNQVNDHNGGEPVKVFGSDSTRLGVLSANNSHMNEHYGNLVTYLRAMGKVPPSSQGR